MKYNPDLDLRGNIIMLLATIGAVIIFMFALNPPHHYLPPLPIMNELNTK